MKRISALLLTLLIGTSGAWTQGKISGLMYGDYFYNIARDTAFARTALPNSALTGEKSLQGFQFRRIYFTYDHDISEQFSGRFRLEADQVAQTTDGKVSVFVKDAFLRWKNLFRGSDLVFGLQPTPAIEIVEAAWGYRSLEKTIVDLRGVAPSRDLGLALRGKVDTAGVFSYWALVANGSGNRPENDKYKRYYLGVHLRPIKNLQVMAYGDYAARAAKTNQFSTDVPKETMSNGVMTYDAFVGYNEADKFSIGLEGFMVTAMNEYVPAGETAYKNRNATGISVWATVNFQPDIAVVGRFDFLDPNTDAKIKGDARNYILGAFVWKPTKNVHLMPNVQVETYEAVPNGVAYDPSVTGRFTFAYFFQ
ncbi:MAG: hypothetical protein H6Q30_2522 [Bacteroidetes bacterium]|nr:hypothetical protein [Bacteroidota bacterium]